MSLQFYIVMKRLSILRSCTELTPNFWFLEIFVLPICQMSQMSDLVLPCIQELPDNLDISARFYLPT